MGQSTNDTKDIGTMDTGTAGNVTMDIGTVGHWGNETMDIVGLWDNLTLGHWDTRRMDTLTIGQLTSGTRGP
jgi:hypothetical protein